MSCCGNSWLRGCRRHGGGLLAGLRARPRAGRPALGAPGGEEREEGEAQQGRRPEEGAPRCLRNLSCLAIFGLLAGPRFLRNLSYYSCLALKLAHFGD